MTIVVAWADIINKNVRTPCHPEATGRRISQRADRPGDSSHPLRMTGVICYSSLFRELISEYHHACHPRGSEHDRRIFLNTFPYLRFYSAYKDNLL